MGFNEAWNLSQNEEKDNGKNRLQLTPNKISGEKNTVLACDDTCKSNISKTSLTSLDKSVEDGSNSKEIYNTPENSGYSIERDTTLTDNLFPTEESYSQFSQTSESIEQVSYTYRERLHQYEMGCKSPGYDTDDEESSQKGE